MARPSQIIPQRDFSAGQIDETAMRRDDTPIFRAGLRTARNVRILNSNALTRRPGRRWLYRTPEGGISELVRPSPGEWWNVEFSAGQIRFQRRFPSSTAPQVFSGKPWTSAVIMAMSWECTGATLFVCHTAFRPLLYTYSAATQTWTESTFGFALNPNGESREPFRLFFAGNGITMTPAARAGSIFVDFSGPVLSPSQIGTRFRYVDQQMIMTGYVNPTRAIMTCVTQLPPTFDVTMDNVDGLQPGDVIEGVDSNAKGNVVSVIGLVAKVIVTKNWSGFITGEFIAGPRWKGKQTSVASSVPGASAVWDESFCSDFRGWPGFVTTDQQRIIFCRFRQFGPAILWSATGTLNDFKPGADADDSIFEFAPENSTVLAVLGGPDEFVLTDTSILFIPISSSAPLKPGSVEFRSIAPIGAAPMKPVQTADGFIYVNASRSRIIAVQATGQAARPYIAEDATQFHTDLIKQPVCIAVTSSDVTAPERYIYVVNQDGSVAVGRYHRRLNSEGWIGWVPWDGEGLVKWVTAGGADVEMTTAYTTSLGTVTGTEVQDDTLLLDASIDITTQFSPAAANWLNGREVSYEAGGWYQGEINAPATGAITDQIPLVLPALSRLGVRFTVELEPFVAQADMAPDMRQRVTRRRVKQAAVKVIRSQALEIAGRDWPFWREGENQEIAPPLREETYRARVMGREFDPRWSLKQDLPGALTILEMTTEATV